MILDMILMGGPKPAPVGKGSGWRWGLLGVLTVTSLVAILARPPIPQRQTYHLFADTRTWLGIPQAGDVLSNLAFLIPGLLGLALCARRPPAGARWSWGAVFAGSALVTFGSGYYHWRPEDWTLLWDRLPMTIAFMGLFSLLLCENVLGEARERVVLPPLLGLGLGSVVWWYLFDDLRIYLWVQFFPLACLVLIPVLFPGRYGGRGWLFLALGLYALAKVTEVHDHTLFQATGRAFSGHSAKHLLAGLAGYVLYRWFRDRRVREDPGSA